MLLFLYTSIFYNKIPEGNLSNNEINIQRKKLYIYLSNRANFVQT